MSSEFVGRHHSCLRCHFNHSVVQMQHVSMSSDAVADSLQELKRRAVLVRIKIGQARLDACFIQNVAILWPSDVDAIGDTSHIVYVI